MKRIAILCLLLALGTPVLAADEVYQGLGQKQGIVQLVDTFVALLQADSRVGSSFEEADIPHLKEKLAEQFCVLAGGPCRYGGKEMATIHDGLDITTAQFYALVEDLQIAMERHGIASRIQNKLLADLAPMQRDVVTR
jgi:hemoglobin